MPHATGRSDAVVNVCTRVLEKYLVGPAHPTQSPKSERASVSTTGGVSRKGLEEPRGSNKKGRHASGAWGTHRHCVRPVARRISISSAGTLLWQAKHAPAKNSSLNDTTPFREPH